jgi:hypothetical protein
MKKKFEVIVEALEDAGCNNGRYPEYRVMVDGKVVAAGVTCRCGRGCSGTDDLSGYYE